MQLRLSSGVDLVEIGRIERVYRQYGERFLRRVYTERESELYRNSVPELAARFAGKEAVSKVLGTGIAGIAWREIEILRDERGKPIVHLAGRAAQRAADLGLQQVEISLTHTRELALAFAVGY